MTEAAWLIDATTFVALEDVDGDFFTDIVTGTFYSQNRLLLNNGSIGPPWTARLMRYCKNSNSRYFGNGQ